MRSAASDLEAYIQSAWGLLTLSTLATAEPTGTVAQPALSRSAVAMQWYTVAQNICAHVSLYVFSGTWLIMLVSTVSEQSA